MNTLIKKEAYNLWLNYNKPVNKDLDIWLEAEKNIYNSYNGSDLKHKGEGAYFRTNEINNKLNIILCPYKETKNYRRDDILLITSNHFKYYNYLYIRVTDINDNGKILDFEWTYGKRNKNYNFNNMSRDTNKFGNVSRTGLYIGRLNNYKLIVSDFFYSDGNIITKDYKVDLIEQWSIKNI